MNIKNIEKLLNEIGILHSLIEKRNTIVINEISSNWDKHKLLDLYNDGINYDNSISLDNK